MATSERETGIDPITAALPPSSDYITFLTILEYQLTPDRLPILTGHLVKDDGTLAREIGWDLVKLILPFLDAAPHDAAKCLEIVARRGNPREVVIVVAEALESLGAEEHDIESGLDHGSEPDGLPTFKGEAHPIHLGEVELHTMLPSSTESQPSAVTPGPEQQQQQEGKEEGGLAVSDLPQLQFSTLLSMLGLLHTRIKSQFPSRFLANSLPAALGAYRRIPITSHTTTAFLALLWKMSGKQRPTLPPRSSTASATHLQSAKMLGTEVYAPLPDPEGRSEENAKAPSDLESSIVLRLLQAVTLEVLEEYLLADPASMEWSTRVLEKLDPNKAIPDRRSRSKAWQDDEDLRSRDGMMNKFLCLAKDLRLDPEAVFRSTNMPLIRAAGAEDAFTDTGGEKDEDEEPSDYPTSPSQIPYPHLGALFLFLASRVPALVYSEPRTPLLDLSVLDLLHFANQFVVPTPAPTAGQFIPSVAHNQPSAIDALLSFLLITPPSTPGSGVKPCKRPADADHKSLIMILAFLSAEHSDPSFRNSAHHLATSLLHNHPSSDFRLATIKSIMTGCAPFDNLKETAIGWLKEEILSTVPKSGSSASTIRSTDDDADKNIFASPTLFSDDKDLGSLIFPVPQTPDPAAASSEELFSQPTPTISISRTAIPSLNLLFLLLSNPTLKSRYSLASRIASLRSSAAIATSGVSTTCEARALQFWTSMQSYVDENAGLASKEEEGRLGLLGLAVGRVTGALEADQTEGLGEEKEREEEEQAAAGSQRRC